MFFCSHSFLKRGTVNPVYFNGFDKHRERAHPQRIFAKFITYKKRSIHDHLFVCFAIVRSTNHFIFLTLVVLVRTGLDCFLHTKILSNQHRGRAYQAGLRFPLRETHLQRQK